MTALIIDDEIQIRRLLRLALESRGYAVRAIEKLGHDPRFPVTSNWPHLVQQLGEFAQAEVATHGGPAYLVGHSMGGFISLMAAANLLLAAVAAGRRAAASRSSA